MNRGAAWNHNRVFELAYGEYFKWAAHDDVHAPTFLERCVELLDSDPAVAWCHSISTHIDAQGRRVEGASSGAGDVGFASNSVDPSWTLPTRESRHPHERFRAVLLGPGGNKDVFGLIRADAKRACAPMIPYYGMDKVFVAELSLQGQYREIPELLFFGRVHPRASGALVSAEEQQQFIAPGKVKRLALPRLHLLAAHIRSVWRADLSIRERLRCYFVVLAYLFQVRKWSSVIRRTVRRTGTGGAYLPTLNRHGGR